MEYKQIHIKAGLAKPVKILYMTDIHLTQADGSDTLRLTEHAQKRTEVFRKEANYPEKTPSEFFEEGLAYGAAHCDVTVITGDVFDFLSKANFAEAKRIMDPYDYMFAAGNHEFCPRVGIQICQTLRTKLYEDVQSYFKENMYFDHREIGGLNIVTIDDSLDYFEDAQCDKLEKVLENGLPTVVFFHVPLDDDYLCCRRVNPALVRTEEMNRATERMKTILRESPQVLAVFAGHWHGFRDEKIVNGKPEYLMAGCFKGIAGEITVE